MQTYNHLLKNLMQSETDGLYFFGGHTKEFYKKQKIAMKIAKKVGIRVNTTADDYLSQWDGYTLYTVSLGHPYGSTIDDPGHASNILHDVAHWIVCTSKNRRNSPDFGLGRGPSSVEAKRSISPSMANTEEQRASMLGILIEFALGFPVFETLLSHNWIYTGQAHEDISKEHCEGWYIYEEQDNLVKTLDFLVKKRLITLKGDVLWTTLSKGCTKRIS